MNTSSVRPGTFVELEITGLDPQGDGTVDENGMLFFVPGAAPGDAVRVRVEHVSRHRNHARAVVVDVIGRGPHYVEPDCSMAIQRGKSCGGCPILHLSVESALEMKRLAVVEALRSEGIQLPVEIHRTPSAARYRNRSNYVVARGRTGRPYLGSYRPHSHQVARMDGCRVLREPIAKVAEEIAYVLYLSETPVYPEAAGLRHVTIRASQQGRVLVDLVVGQSDTPWLFELAASLMRIREIAGVSYSVNDEDRNAIRIAGSTLLSGDETVQEYVGDVSFPLKASSFSQLNSDVAGVIYREAAAALTAAVVVWDLYCGAGGLGLNTLKKNPATKLYGADVIEETIALARLASEKVSRNAHFETIDLSERIPDWPRPDAVLVNPPRRGLDSVVRSALCAMSAPAKLVYMSCSPRSFARDAAILTQSGWCLESVKAFDMLPGTAHVELLALFSKTGGGAAGDSESDLV